MVNKITLIGHLGQDPEVRRLDNGSVVARFSVATSESYKDNDGNLQSQTEWHSVTAWRVLAEQAERLLKKGSLVFVEGKMQYRKYTDKNGIERISAEILASTFRILDKREGSGGGLRESSFPTQEPATMQNRPQTAGAKEPIFEVVTPMSDAPAPDDDLPF